MGILAFLKCSFEIWSFFFSRRSGSQQCAIPHSMQPFFCKPIPSSHYRVETRYLFQNGFLTPQILFKSSKLSDLPSQPFSASESNGLMRHLPNAVEQDTPFANWAYWNMIVHVRTIKRLSHCGCDALSDLHGARFADDYPASGAIFLFLVGDFLLFVTLLHSPTNILPLTGP